MHEERIRIRWRDLDAYGHVNNAVYLNYLEEARDAVVQKVLGPVTNTWDFVLARVAIDYRAELTQDDGEVLVRCRLHTIGRASLRTREEVAKLDGTLSAEAESVVVAATRDRTGAAAHRGGTRGARSRVSRRKGLSRRPAHPAAGTPMSRRARTNVSRYQPVRTSTRITPPAPLDESSAHPFPTYTSTWSTTPSPLPS